jgi:hypothetical protein
MLTARMLERGRRPFWLAVIAILAMAAGFSTSPGRRLARRFVKSLRVQNVQAVNVDLSAFVGPNANGTLQQMVGQMISDKVNVTVNEKEQTVPDAAAASQLAGFPVQLLGGRKNALHVVVGVEHVFTLTADRARLQAIFDEAGRHDRVVPSSVEGAAVAVRMPRTVRAQYGNCPGPSSAAANVATPPPASTQYSDCVILTEGHSPVVNVPPGLDVEQFAQIGLELAGMSPTQAHEFLQTVSWTSTLGLPVPRALRSYEAVTVNGAPGTLLNTAGRRGAAYTLIWAKNGLVYSLTGFGNSGEAVALADSLE